MCEHGVLAIFVQTCYLLFYFLTPSTVRETSNLRLLDVNELLTHFSEHPTHLHIFARQHFNACEKGNRINVPTHINAHFARYLAFLFYYIYLNVWIFKSKQANTIQHYTLIHIIVKKCNDNCSKPRQHRTSNKYPDLVLI